MMTPEQTEIVDLLRNEIAGMIESDVKVREHSEADTQKNTLQQLETELEHFANACELSGLVGLELCSRHLAKNFQLLAEQCPLDTDKVALCSSWAIHYLGYLMYLGDEERELKQVNNLMSFLVDEGWPIPVCKDQELKFRLDFGKSDLSYITADENRPPVEATPEMASLESSEDVRSELMSSMLVELPEQVRVFEDSISSFLESNSLDELANARRMAHTLKGAANIVGINGLSNLMHFTEDLMEIAVKQQWQIIPKGFAALLLEASDCLATVSEYVTGFDEKPSTVQATQQKLLDWIHAIYDGKTPGVAQDLSVEGEIDLDGYFTGAEVEAGGMATGEAKGQSDPLVEHISELEAELDLIIQSCELESSSDTSGEVESFAKEEKHFLHFPESTAHELLRIAGEVQIGNAQISTKVEHLRTNIKFAEKYHKKIRAMAGDLDAFVQMQSSMQMASRGHTGEEIDPLEMERFSELHTYSNQLLELATDSYEAIVNMGSQLAELSELSYAQNKLNEDCQAHLLHARQIPVKNVSSRFHRCVRQACKLAKKSARLYIRGENVLMDSRVLNLVADPIMHLLRNAVDHGIETSTERQAVGKPEEGKIILSFSYSRESINIECSDDGAGIDYKKIRKIAMSKKLFSEEGDVEKSILNQFIMLPGVTTKEGVSRSTGRGLGLVAVAESLRMLKGRINIYSEEGNSGCLAKISVPASTLSGHVLVAKSTGDLDDHMLCFASRTIEQVVHVTESSFQRGPNGLSYEHEGKEIPVYSVNDLVNIHLVPTENFSALLIVNKHDGSTVGVAVESIVSSQNLVIKPLNPLCMQLPGVVGATILGDGTVSPVIDVLELPGMTMSRAEFANIQKQKQVDSLDTSPQAVSPPVALIVDDSLSARRSLAQFVSDMGMKVYTAKDGFEAIAILEKTTPALLLVDLEMPRMNGLELTTHLRSREDTRDIPVIMITSRSTEKHRLRAESAGVNTYIKKPWSEEELMNSIHHQIA